MGLRTAVCTPNWTMKAMCSAMRSAMLEGILNTWSPCSSGKSGTSSGTDAEKKW